MLAGNLIGPQLLAGHPLWSDICFDGWYLDEPRPFADSDGRSWESSDAAPFAAALDTPWYNKNNTAFQEPASNPCED